MRVIPDHELELELLESHIRSLGASGRTLEILDAGCGHQWQLSMKGISFRVTGVDLDPRALEVRKSEKNDLTEALVGDLRTIALPEGKYDVIYSSFVLEHLSEVTLVLDKFAHWLKPGGIIILRIPDRDSVFGFVSRMTPFWIYVLYHRFVCETTNAGKPGFDPYPTVHEKITSQRDIREFARQHDLKICEELGTGGYSIGRPPFRMLIPILARAVALVTFGRIHNKFCSLAYVMEKPVQ